MVYFTPCLLFFKSDVDILNQASGLQPEPFVLLPRNFMQIISVHFILLKKQWLSFHPIVITASCPFVHRILTSQILCISNLSPGGIFCTIKAATTSVLLAAIISNPSSFKLDSKVVASHARAS